MSLETATALFLLTAGLGCGNDWRTDMWFEPGGGLHSIARAEPVGSVPLGARPHFDDRDEAEGLKAAFPTDAASVARGRALFADRCQACHGGEGHGGGPVGRYFPPAPDLGYPAIQARPDGYIYATLLLGGRAMPVMREGLDQRDLWDLVHFVRTVRPAATPPAPPGAAPATPPGAAPAAPAMPPTPTAPSTPPTPPGATPAATPAPEAKP